MAANITEAEFEANFNLVDNPGGENTVWELEDIEAAGIPERRVWALTDGDDEGVILAMAGFHPLESYFGFCVTEEEWDNKDQVAVYSGGPDQF